MKPRLYTKYIEEVRPALTQKRGYQNVHQVPRIEKIVINDLYFGSVPFNVASRTDYVTYSLSFEAGEGKFI